MPRLDPTRASGAPPRAMFTLAITPSLERRPSDARRDVEAELEERLGFERLISELSADMARTAPNSADQRIERWLARISMVLGLDRATFFEYVAETESYRRMAFWSAIADADSPPALVGPDRAPHAVSSMRAGQRFAYERMDQVPASDRWIYERVGIKSVLGVPAFVDGVSFGALVLGVCRAERHWSDELIQRVCVIADIFANAFARKRAEHDRRIQRELEQALEFRELVMGILSHDLRSPLNAARGLAQLVMRQTDLPPGANRRLGAIMQSIDRMDDLIDTLFDFTEARFKGELTIARTEIDLREVCLRIANEQMAIYPSRTILSRCDAPVIGHWDPTRMEQVVSNLLSNGLTHGSAAGTVTLSLSVTDEHAIIEVANDGDAIPPNVLTRLFEPFRRGTTTKPGARRGLGLGLYIVRQIVIAHGGTVDARSSLDAGTVFIVRLPVTDA